LISIEPNYLSSVGYRRFLLTHVSCVLLAFARLLRPSGISRQINSVLENLTGMCWNRKLLQAQLEAELNEYRTYMHGWSETWQSECSD
jgi:hypothetical protein